MSVTGFPNQGTRNTKAMQSFIIQCVVLVRNNDLYRPQDTQAIGHGTDLRYTFLSSLDSDKERITVLKTPDDDAIGQDDRYIGLYEGYATTSRIQ